MKQITQKMLRDAVWAEVYAYGSDTLNFEIWASDQFPKLTITYDYTRGKRSRTTYTVHGRKTDSIIQAVRIYNEEAKRVNGGRSTAGSPKSVGRAPGGTVL